MENLNKRRAFKKGLNTLNVGKGSKIYLLQISITFLVVTIFFLLNFIYNVFLYTGLKEVNNVFNTTLQAESLYTFAFNLEREKVINSQFQVYNYTGLQTINSTLEQIYDLNNKIILVR